MNKQKKERIKQINRLFDKHGQAAIARVCGVKPQSVFKWKSRGLPRTDLLGETDYAKKIEKFDNEFTREKLLALDSSCPAAGG